MATVDIRGTGSSEGAVPPREYSEQELDDAMEIIDQLSRMPGSNGRVGMWGKSWGGFNAIQVAMREPPALKAILAVEATDDLFHDDVHNMDGAFHIDQFEQWMDHLLILPQTPTYELDEDYFENRFESYPWFLTYAKQQRDGEFWRRNSLRWQYDKLKIPAYLIGGLLDGYRDSVPRMLENVKAPVRAAIGPYEHHWPDNGVPGPNYEWRHEAVRWWDYWLKDRDTGIMEDAPLAVFVREGHGPDLHLKTTPGHWISDEWPIPGTTWKKFYPSVSRQLRDQLENGEKGVESLRYVPSYGVATGLWWGEPTGDMRPDDAGSLVFDSPVLEEGFEIVGTSPRAPAGLGGRAAGPLGCQTRGRAAGRHGVAGHRKTAERLAAQLTARARAARARRDLRPGDRPALHHLDLQARAPRAARRFQLAIPDDLAHPAPDDHRAAPGRGEHAHGAARDPARGAQGAGVPAA